MKCKVRSGWVENGLEKHREPVWLRSGKGVGVELMEDLEDRGDVSWVGGRFVVAGSESKDRQPEDSSESEQGLWSQAGTEDSRKTSSPTSPNTGDLLKSNDTNAEESVPTLQSVTSPSPIPIKTHTKVADLLANLTIHERPTPLTPPTAPSLTPVRPIIPASTPLEPPPPSPLSTTTNVDSPRTNGKRQPPSSMLSTSTTRLANTLMSASKGLAGAINAAKQVADDSEGEEEWEEEWEKEMGWGDEGDEEFRSLFEEAKMARELMEADKGAG